MSDTSGVEDHSDVEVRVTELERRLGVYSGPWQGPVPFPCRLIINLNIPPHHHDHHDHHDSYDTRDRDAQLAELLERVRRLEEQAGPSASPTD